MIKTQTWSLCKECYGIVPATFDGSVLTKTCSFHGEQSTLVDPDPMFQELVDDLPKHKPYRVSQTALSVTNRCNLRCPGCYALPDDSADDDIDSIVEIAAKGTGDAFVLMGSEPTMRDDLSELVVKLKDKYKKYTSIYTNGIKLEDESFVENLELSGLDAICLSLHLPNYVGEIAFNKKIKAIENIKKSKISLNHLAFSLKSIDEVENALRLIIGLDYSCIASGFVRLRAPSVMGGKRNYPAHMSDMLRYVRNACESNGFKFEFVPFTNHRYAIMIKVEGKMIMLVRWPTVEEIDLEECQHGPVRALFVPEIGETQILHQGMMTERVRSGGAFPPPPPIDCPDYISGRQPVYAN